MVHLVLILAHFFVFFRHLMKNVFLYQNDIVCMQIQGFTIVSNPKGDKKTPSIRICVRHAFHVFSTYYEKRFSIKMTLFFKQLQEFTIVSSPKGDKKHPLSESAFDTFFMFSRHLMNQVRHIPNRYAKNLPMTKLISR